MNCRATEFHSQPRLGTLILVSLAIMVTVTGCARKPWRQPIAEDSRGMMLQVVDEMRQADAQRATCIDADVDIFYTNHLKSQAINGYMQLMQPASVKLISSNPLGQPLIAFVSDGNSIQFVNTFDQFFTDGNLKDFAELYEIPQVAYERGWGNWLTGRLPSKGDVTALRQDEAQRGIWVSIAATEATTPLNEHLLINPEKKLLLGRIYTDDKDNIDARVDYSNWLPGSSGDPSPQPGQITITHLDYGGKLLLRFADLREMEYCSGRDFILHRPPGYRYEPLLPATSSPVN